MVDFDDDFIIGAKKSVSVRNYDKNDQKICLSSFKKYFIDEFKIDTLLQNSFSGDIEKLSVRATLWKILLGTIPNNQNYSSWIDSITKERNSFKSKLKTFKNLKKLAGDPLGGLNESSSSTDGWNSFFKDNELKKLINLDISRTYQDKELFQNTTIKELLTNILFIWAKENPDPSYRQGMNEILAILLFAIYPFYFTFDKKSSISASSINSMKKDENFAKELYCFLYDEDEMQADLYCLFENMMKRGILNLYSDGNDESSKNGDKDSKKKRPIQSQAGDSELPSENEKPVSTLQRRCNRIYIEFLKCIDQELYNYLVKIDVNPTLFLVRWLKCLLSREFHHRDVIVLMDTILANDLHEKLFDEKSNKITLDNLNMLDYLCVSMITYIREDILRKDQVECLQRLFKYPPIESPVTLIKMAMNIKSVVIKKLIFKEEVSSSPTIPKVNSSSQINQVNYGSNNTRAVLNSHPLEKSKSENQSLENTVIISSYQMKSNEVSNSKIGSVMDCVKKLEVLNEKYKDKLDPKDLEEFNRVLDYLRKNKY